jgi:hypothetical protein
MKNLIKNNDAFKLAILKVADEILPNIRKPKFTHEYYLNMFDLVLDDVTKWKSLVHTKMYNSNKLYHYKSISNEFNRWSKHDIIKIAYERHIKGVYVEKFNDSKNKSRSVNLYTDTSCYNNKFGRENVGVHPELHKKNTTKIASLIDENKMLLAMIEVKTHLKKYEGDEYKFKNPYTNTFEHDIKTVQPLLDNLLIDVPSNKKINICGDGAYKSQEIFTYNDKKINLIASKNKKSKKQIKKMISKKNDIIADINKKIESQKNENKKNNLIIKKQNLLNETAELNKNSGPKYTQKEKYMLGKRYLVENYFRNTKKYDRIMIRKEHNIKNFLSFIYMANLKNIIIS